MSARGSRAAYAARRFGGLLIELTNARRARYSSDDMGQTSGQGWRQVYAPWVGRLLAPFVTKHGRLGGSALGVLMALFFGVSACVGKAETTIDGPDPCDGLDHARLCVEDMLVVCENGEEAHREVCELGCSAGECLSDDPCDNASEDGWYCGEALGASASNMRYHCVGGSAASSEYCPHGCEQGDCLASEDPCDNAPADGWYCADALGDSSSNGLYHCVGGISVAFEDCPHGCEEGSCLSDDPCESAPSDGWYCANALGAGSSDTRYHCVGGSTVSSEYCAHGCQGGECLTPDTCASAPSDGWYCGDALGAGSSDTRYHCIGGTAVASEYCDNGCVDGECVTEPLELLQDGVYFFYVKASGKALNLYASTDERADRDGTNVTVWDATAHNTQRFRVENIGGDRFRVYAMSSSLGTNRVLDVCREDSGELQVGNNIQLWRSVAPTDQEWIISKVEGDYYKFELAHLPGGVMGTDDPGTNGGNVFLQEYTGSAAQLWEADFLSDGDCITPVEYYESLGWRVTQEFWSDSTFNPQHRGLDFGGQPCNHPVKSIYPGTVVAARTSGMGSWGHTVVVEIAPGWYQHNSHLNAVHVSVGQQVDRGTQIGLNGGTNHSGDPFPCHIHLEIYQNDPVDPNRPWNHPDGGLVEPGTGLVNPRDFCM